MWSKAIVLTTLLVFIFQCNGDVSTSINQRLPLSSSARIPSPAQSLLPPTFENPIKDYTVGLVPPPIEGNPAHNEPVHNYHQQTKSFSRKHPSPYASGFINTARPIEYTTGSQRFSVHHQTHQITSPVQSQVYQPKAIVYHQFQQPTIHSHQQQRHSTGFVTPPVVPHYSYSNLPLTPQYSVPVTQKRVYQHSTHARYASVPVHRAPIAVEHVHPSVQRFVSRPVSSSGVKIIQSYPSVSYAVETPQHGSTLNLGNAKLDPDLVHIISEVLGQNHSN